MASTEITQKTYAELPPPDISEILRYLGAKEADTQTLSLIEDCIKEASGKLSYRAIYREYAISQNGGELDLGFSKVYSKDLSRNLAGCKKIILFACTLGAEADRLIYRYTRTAPSRAVVLDALMSERVEALCDRLEQEATEGKKSRPRFSAGYGDLSIELQKDIFTALDCERRIGLTLGGSLLMSPTKSVTAIIGITE